MWIKNLKPRSAVNRSLVPSWQSNVDKVPYSRISLIRKTNVDKVPYLRIIHPKRVDNVDKVPYSRVSLIQ